MSTLTEKLLRDEWGSYASLRRRAANRIEQQREYSEKQQATYVEDMERQRDAVLVRDRRIKKLEAEIERLTTIETAFIKYLRIEAEESKGNTTKQVADLIDTLIEIRDNPRCTPPDIAAKALG